MKLFLFYICPTVYIIILAIFCSQAFISCMFKIIYYKVCLTSISGRPGISAVLPLRCWGRCRINSMRRTDTTEKERWRHHFHNNKKLKNKEVSDCQSRNLF